MIKKSPTWIALSLCFLHSFSLAAGDTGDRADIEAKNEQSPSLVSQFNKAIIGSREAADKRDYRNALEHSSVSLKLAEEALTDKPKQLAALIYNHGVLLYRAGQYEEAIQPLKQALSHYEDLYGKEGSELLPLISHLALASGRAHQPSSKKYFKRGRKLTKLLHGSPSIEYANLLIREGVTLSFYISRQQGKKALIKGREMAVELEGESSKLAGWASFNIGKLELSKRDWDASSEHLLNALSSFEEPDKPSNQIELSTHAFLVQAFSEQDEQELATRHCLAIGRMTPYSEDQDYLPIYKEQPKYPTSALRAGKSGWSIVEFDVDEQGFVHDPRVVQKSSATFDRTSITAASSFRYAPAFKNGKPVATKNVQNKIIYSIAD